MITSHELDTILEMHRMEREMFDLYLEMDIKEMVRKNQGDSLNEGDLDLSRLKYFLEGETWDNVKSTVKGWMETAKEKINAAIDALLEKFRDLRAKVVAKFLDKKLSAFRKAKLKTMKMQKKYWLIPMKTYTAGVGTTNFAQLLASGKTVSADNVENALYGDRTFPEYEKEQRAKCFTTQETEYPFQANEEELKSYIIELMSNLGGNDSLTLGMKKFKKMCNNELSKDDVFVPRKAEDSNGVGRDAERKEQNATAQNIKIGTMRAINNICNLYIRIAKEHVSQAWALLKAGAGYKPETNPDAEKDTEEKKDTGKKPEDTKKEKEKEEEAAKAKEEAAMFPVWYTEKEDAYAQAVAEAAEYDMDMYLNGNGLDYIYESDMEKTILSFESRYSFDLY